MVCKGACLVSSSPIQNPLHFWLGPLAYFWGVMFDSRPKANSAFSEVLLRKGTVEKPRRFEVICLLNEMLSETPLPQLR